MNETWKEIRGYEGLYEVSDLGRVRSLGRIVKSKNDSRQKKHARILTQEITIHGYCRVRLFNGEGIPKHFAVHRLVLNTFVGDSDLQINHLNEIKTDNRLSNLEYCNAKDNCNYGTRNKRLSEILKGKNAKETLQYTKEGVLVQKYPSREDAEKATGVDAGHIGSCCDNKRKTAGGYIWRNA